MFIFIPSIKCFEGRCCLGFWIFVSLAKLFNISIIEFKYGAIYIPPFRQAQNAIRRIEPFVKRGKDKLIRYSPIEITIIHFTEHQLVTYQCAFDLTIGEPLNARIKRFFYRTVCNYLGG